MTSDVVASSHPVTSPSSDSVPTTFLAPTSALAELGWYPPKTPLDDPTEI